MTLLWCLALKLEVRLFEGLLRLRGPAVAGCIFIKAIKTSQLIYESITSFMPQHKQLLVNV